MKQFICTLIVLAASAGLLFLVSAPINNLHGAGDHEETHVEGHVDGHAEEGEESADHGEAHAEHGDSADTDAAAH